MEKLRIQREDPMDKEVSKLATMLMKETGQNRTSLLQKNMAHKRTFSTGGNHETENDDEEGITHFADSKGPPSFYEQDL